jgi:hypothetical protein
MTHWYYNEDGMREKVEDLKNSLTLSNGYQWSEWELQFIDSVSQKLDDIVFSLSDRQEEKVFELWEKI